MKNNKQKAQVTLEFTFCFVVVLLLIYGCIMAFKWAGVSLAARQKQHNDTLTSGINEQWVEWETGPLKQLNPDFAEPVPMDMVFNRW